MLICIIILQKKDPNKLLSEEYNLESQKIAFAYDEHKGIKGDNSTVYITTASQPQKLEESNK